MTARSAATGGLNISGSGQSVLNGANTYTGVTTVNSGTLVVGNDTGLGAGGTGNGTDVADNATLELEGSITVTGELLTSSAFYSSVTIQSVGNNVWTGDMTMANELDVQVAAGNSLEVDGNITGHLPLQLRCGPVDSQRLGQCYPILGR